MTLFQGITVFITIALPIGVFALWTAAQYDKKYANILYKLQLMQMGIGHMLFSSDKRFPKKTPTPNDLVVEKTKKIIFVRHAESAWNLVFNKGFKVDFLGRLGSAVSKEAKMFSTLDSIFFDSPLSEEGTKQARELRTFLESDLGENSDTLEGSSIIVSSNLRRALSTGTIGFWKRLQRTNEKVHVLSSLQEVTFNVDGVSLAKPYGSPQLSATEVNALGIANQQDFLAEEFFNCSENAGNKVILSSGLARLKEFAGWCFEKEQEKYDTIIANGHSLYYRFFFKYFLDAKSTHEAKVNKMANCSVVKFELQQGTKDGKTWYRIPEESLKVLYLGFEKSKAKKHKEKAE